MPPRHARSRPADLLDAASRRPAELLRGMLRVADVMHESVLKAPPDMACGRAADLLAEHGEAHLALCERDPVTGREDFLGLVGRQELWRQLPGEAPRTSGLRAADEQPLLSVMRRGLPVATGEDSVEETARRLAAMRSEGLAVVAEGGRLQGVVDTWDLLRVTRAAIDLGSLAAGGPAPLPGFLLERLSGLEDVMDPQPPVLGPEGSLREARHLLLRRGRRQLVVADRRARPLGVFGEQELLGALPPLDPAATAPGRSLPWVALLHVQPSAQVLETPLRLLMTPVREAIRVSRDTSLAELVDRLQDMRKSRALVVAPGRGTTLEGLVTETDLLVASAAVARAVRGLGCT